MSNDTQTELTVGPVIRTDSGYNDAFRIGEDGALIVSDGHGRFYEMASRNQVYSVTTALAGTTIAAGNVAPPAAAAATVLSILNPVGSGMNLEIIRGWVRHISATTGPVGYWAWCGAVAGMSITAAEATAVKRANFVGQAVPLFKAWSQAALTGGPAHTNVRPFPVKFIAAAVAGTSWGLDAVDNVDGALIVEPGGLLTLAPAATGTTVVVGAGIILAQAPRPEL